MQYKLKKKITKVLVMSDVHAPDFNPGALNCFYKFADYYKPDVVVVLGDVGDFGSVSAWDRKKQLVIEGKRIKDDMDSAVNVLNDLANITRKAERFITLGNHEDRVRRYIEFNAVLHGLEEMDVISRFENAGYRVEDYGKFLKIGKLLFTHGLYTNSYHANKTLQQVGRSIVYGHTHDHQEHSISHFDDNPNFPQEKEASSSGCLCNMNPEYLRNRPKKWTHGFQTVDFLSNGLFFRSFHKIINGMTVINGKVFNGKESV